METTTFQCSNCSEIVLETDQICPNCKFPIKGTEKEQAIFIGQQVMNRRSIKKAKDFRKYARYILLLVAIVNLVAPVAKVLGPEFYLIDILVNIFIGITFIILYLRARKPVLYPYVIGVVLLMAIYIINGIIDPGTIIKGLIGKVIFLCALIIGFGLTYSEREIKKNHKNLSED